MSLNHNNLSWQLQGLRSAESDTPVLVNGQQHPGASWEEGQANRLQMFMDDSELGRPVYHCTFSGNGVLATPYFLSVGSEIYWTAQSWIGAVRNVVIELTCVRAVVVLLARKQAGAGFSGQAGVGGTALARSTAMVMTAGLQPGATDRTARIAMDKAGLMLVVTTDRPARVIFYATAAARTSDAGRAAGTPAQRGAGVLAEVITTPGNLTVAMTPFAEFLNLETPVVGTIPLAVTNKDVTGGTVTVTVTKLTLEA